MKMIGVGFGRTGTMSLKAALVGAAVAGFVIGGWVAATVSLITGRRR